MKTCVRCGFEKPLTDFYRDVRYADWRPRGACKVCLGKARPKQIVVPERKECSQCGTVKPAAEFLPDPRHADGLRSECAECFYTKTRYLKTLEWRRANPNKIAEYNRRLAPNRACYAERNPDIIRAVQTRRRARKAGTINSLTAAEWRAIKETYGYKCAYCGAKPKRLTVEHVVPLAKGGAHAAHNVVPACWPCNNAKNTAPAPTHQPHLLV